jgi:choline dehydrogenase-like flavoprotein
MMDYNHWSPLGLLGEILPWEDNRIELADGKDGRHDARDRFGLPVAQVTFSLKDNDKKLIEYGKNVVMDIMLAAGAKEIVQESRYAHLVGGARMSTTSATGVCDKFGRAWDVPNLFITDGSVFPTQGSANPGLTIQALAARTADYVISQADAVFSSSKRDMTEPPCRRTLSPPGTFSKGVPHF